MTGQDARDELARTLAGLDAADWAEAKRDGLDHLAMYFETADVLTAAGYRKHPEPEITNEMVHRASASLHEWGLPDVPPELESTIARDALEAAFESSARVSEPTATVSSDG